MVMNMKRTHSSLGFKLFLALAIPLLLWTILVAPKVNASPDPLNVSWYVTDSGGNPIDNAHLTIYWSTSTSGPFTQMSSSIVEDKIASAYQNPFITGYWNPTYQHGYALADLHITSVGSYYFYVTIDYDAQPTWYWPVATSVKPGDPTWTSVVATGSPSGFAASGSGFGNGITTAYPTQPPPPQVIPEVPLGPAMALLSMMVASVIYVGMKRRKVQP